MCDIGARGVCFVAVHRLVMPESLCFTGFARGRASGVCRAVMRDVVMKC